MPRLLIVDDELQITRALDRSLRHDFDVTCFNDPIAALARIEEIEPDVVISDFRMPGMNGAEFLAGVNRIAPNCVRVMLSGFADLSSVAASVHDGELGRFVPKPWDDDELLAMLKSMLEERRSSL